MRIRAVKTIVVGNPWKNWVFVKVETDEGLVGWSEATMGLNTRPVEAALHELAPCTWAPTRGRSTPSGTGSTKAFIYRPTPWPSPP